MIKLLTTVFVSLTVSAAVSVQAQQVSGNADEGARKTAMCMGCHGIAGYQSSFPEVHKVPKIAGQSASYIGAALAAYKDGGRKHPTMRAVAASLSEQDIADLAAYYGQLGLKDGAAPVAVATRAPDAAVQALIMRDAANNCTTCHGVDFNTPKDATVPRLAGQYADYLAAALRAYKTADHALIGRSNGIMAPQAQKYSNAEIRQLAAYISTLPGQVKTVPESRLHAASN